MKKINEQNGDIEKSNFRGQDSRRTWSVRRAIQEFGNTGVAGIHIEDQVFPKRCGRYAGKQVVSREERVGKLHAVREALHEDNVVIMARTDARAVYGLSEAIKNRVNGYVKGS